MLRGLLGQSKWGSTLRLGQRRAEDSFKIATLCQPLLPLLFFSKRGLRAVAHGSPKTQLQFSFGSTVKLLVNGGVLAVQEDERTGTVGEALEDDVNILRDAKKLAEL